MADVRALLKAKRQETKITHPFATYSSSGQLRCSACGTLVKHASAWEGHLGSKGHRTNVARLKEEERRRQEEAEQAEREAQAHAVAEAAKQTSNANGKRKATDEDGDDMEEDTADHDMDVDISNTTKRRRVGPAPSAFPADFFSDPSHAPILTSTDSDDEEIPPDTQPQPTEISQPPTAIDLEYERFQREMLSLGGPQAPDEKADTYERATVMAEPQLVEIDEIPGGFPAQDQQMDMDAEKEKQSEEEVARRQKEQDERELIMDRLLDEERAQEEADQRVSVMKARLEALKKKRGARKVKESGSGS